MSNEKRELAEFLKEVSGWTWWEFLKAEHNEKYTTRQSIVFATIRAAAMENLGAIITSINRLDGKVATPVQVVMPKVYFLFPNATEVEKVIEGEVPVMESTEIAILTPEEFAEEPPSQSFRDTARRMANQSRALPGEIIACQEKWENFHRNRGLAPEGSVMVSSVVVAHFFNMAQNRNMKALYEVFDQLDGKLVETIRIVGEDMYLVRWGSVAPAGAVKNEKGEYQIEVPRMSRMWGERLDPTKKNSVQAIIQED